MARSKIHYPEKTIYQQDTQVRISDLSTANHLGFDNLVVILNDASAGFFKANGLERGGRSDNGFIYTDLTVNYLNEAFCGETLRIEIAVNDVGAKRFDLLFRVSSTQKEKVVALAKIGVLFFDYQNHRSINMPAQFRDRIRPAKTSCGRTNT